MFEGGSGSGLEEERDGEGEQETGARTPDEELLDEDLDDDVVISADVQGQEESDAELASLWMASSSASAGSQQQQQPAAAGTAGDLREVTRKSPIRGEHSGLKAAAGRRRGQPNCS